MAWLIRDNHAGHVIATAVLTDADGVTLPGLTLVIEAKAPVVTSRCLFLLGIQYNRRGKKGRVYQLEVCPTDKRSHNGMDGPIYGPHEHVGEAGDSVTPLAHPEVSCSNWLGVWAWFVARCNLDLEVLESPC